MGHHWGTKGPERKRWTETSQDQPVERLGERLVPVGKDSMSKPPSTFTTIARKATKKTTKKYSDNEKWSILDAVLKSESPKSPMGVQFWKLAMRKACQSMI